MEKTLVIKNLYASIEKKSILNGISFSVVSGQVHAIMGPNGSGKSTLAQVLMGNSTYECQMLNAKCQIKIGKKDILPLSTEERARAGLFLAFQSPIALPGVSVVQLLKTAYLALHAKPVDTTNMHNPVLARRLQGGEMADLMKKIKDSAKFLRIDESFLHRGIGDGFSGGEKKKMEILQALVMSPAFAIFDEIDTGLDVDALKTVAAGIALLKKQGTGIIVITHYQRILKYLKPDVVHVLVAGKIMETGDAKLAKKIEEKGYQTYLKTSD